MSYFEGPCLNLNKENLKPDLPKQVVVIGAPRGGTSMVAGICHHLGVNMGSFDNEWTSGYEVTKKPYAMYEDHRFVHSHSGDRLLFKDALRKEQCVNSILEAVLTSNNLGETWGWKDPLAIHYIQDVRSELNNPVFLYVWRSPISVAKGELRFNKRLGVAVNKSHFHGHMRNILDHYELMLSLSATFKHIPSLHINYEQVISSRGKDNKPRLVRDIARMCGIKLNNDTLDKCVKFIK